MSPVENKEHKPGPIGKERSLKNRKVKDAQQAEPEGQEKPSPAAVRSTDPVTTKESKAVAEMSTEIGAMISVSSTEYGADVKVGGPRWPQVRVVQTMLTVRGEVGTALILSVLLFLLFWLEA